MNDISRDIGGLEARMDEHDKRFDRLECKVDDGFKAVSGQFVEINGKLDALAAERNQRKGAMGLVKLILGASGLAGAIEFIKELIHR